MSNKMSNKKTWWYTYRQNNSGGSFVRNENLDVAVIVEAHSSEEADARAEALGIYFDGCDDGQDCKCCGDRWIPTSNYYAYEEPAMYAIPLKNYKSFSSVFVEKIKVHPLTNPPYTVQPPGGTDSESDYSLKSRAQLEESR